jgi:hypothetical protein
MNRTLYRNKATAAKAVLTTDSPASSYGIPALRITARGAEDWPDLSPAGLLPSGMTAAEFVVTCFKGLPEGTGGEVPRLDRQARQMARAFLSQWPDGPQLPGD